MGFIRRFIDGRINRCIYSFNDALNGSVTGSEVDSLAGSSIGP